MHVWCKELKPDAMQGRGRGRGDLEREPSFSFDANGPYSLQTRLDMEAIGDTGMAPSTWWPTVDGHSVVD